MSFYKSRQWLTEQTRNAVDRITVERLTRGGAHVALLGATAFAALGFFEDGYPSESEQAEIYACADQLGSAPTKIYRVADECTQFTDEFEEVDEGYADYVVPSRNAFLDETIWTSHIEEEREKDFGQSMTLLTVSLSLYGASSFARRIRSPEEQKIIDEAEAILRDTPNDK